jgi:hypothetical protein
MIFLVIQHLILEGHTTDAIDKTKELFPTLLNNKNLLFALKVRQFIEMINGTESEISSPSTILKTKKSSSPRSSSPVTKPHTSSRSRSNSTNHPLSRRSSANNTEGKVHRINY